MISVYSYPLYTLWSTLDITNGMSGCDSTQTTSCTLNLGSLITKLDLIIKHNTKIHKIMERVIVNIGDKIYKCQVAKNEEDRRNGL